MKLMEVYLLLILLGLGNCEPMTDYEICHSFGSIKSQVVCDFQNIELMIRWRTNHVIIFKNRQNSVRIKCNHSSGIDFRNFPILDMSGIKELIIETCSIEDENILSNIMHFFNFTGVSMLRMETAKNYSISSTLLNSFSHIKTFELVAKDMNTFTENAFENFFALENLTITAYDITMLPQKLFKPLKKLKNLEIILISDDPKNISKNFNFRFKETLNLETFSLRGVRWPSQMEFSFGSVLNKISITNCFLNKIDQKLFGSATEIYFLNLSHNHIQHVPDQFLWPLEDFLNILDLSYNQIAAITDETFSKSSELTTLDLSNNCIEKLEKNAFSKLEYLTALKLNNNFLTIIDLPILFNGLLSLQQISLNDNKIYEIIDELPRNLMLKEIDMSKNKLTNFFISKFWPKSSDALTIKLSGNDLHGIGFPISKVESENKNALKINLGEDGAVHCDCHTVKLHQYFHGVNLSTDIENYIEIFPQTIACKNSSWDKVITIDPMKVKCPLDISPHENICPRSCDCTVGMADNKLTVKCFNILSVPAMPPKISLNTKRITEIKLDIEDNSVIVLPSKEMGNYNLVTEIYARNNKITTLTSTNIPDNLNTLDLRSNNLQTIDSAVIAKLAMINVLQLSDNPWKCSGLKAMQLIEFVKSHQDIIKDWNLNRCSNGEYFLAIREENIGECHLYIYVTVMLCLLAFLCVGVGILCWRNQRAVVEWIHQRDRYHVIERFRDFLKPFDACIVCAQFDTIFANFLGSRLIKAPNNFKKCALIVKNWKTGEKIPEKMLRAFRNSRRVIVVLSDYLDEDNWTREWPYSIIGTRIIFIAKGECTNSKIGFSNSILINFDDPWFWEKLKHAMVRYEELVIEGNPNIEMQPLTVV